MRGEKRSSYHFILLTYHSFQLIFSILKAINSAEFAVESIICRTSFEFCQLAHLYNFCQPAIIWIMCTFFSLSNFAVTARKLSYVSEKLFQFTSLTTEETRFSTASLEYDIKRIGKRCRLS